MKLTLIIDSNIVLSAMLSDTSILREILIDSPFTLLAPETLLKEIRKYKEYICKKAGFTDAEFEQLFFLLTDSINICEKEVYYEKLEEAELLLGKDAGGDIAFLALALSIANDGIWTEDKLFEKQNKVKFWKIKEVVNNYLGV